MMLGLAAWAGRRSKRAAAVILANALGEGTAASITRFPAGLWPLISFRAHVRIGQVGGPFFLALGCMVPRVPKPERRVLIFLGILPILINGLSDISDESKSS
ncbi:MAG: hypothetical protein JWR44_2619 [Hymenobacter sp.]|jgi:hypothetical protein|nr:hypothetical protein [Hymenobacter sp.]